MNKHSKSRTKNDDNKTYHVECTFPADLSCHWKVLNMGSGCKLQNFSAISAGAHLKDVQNLEPVQKDAKGVRSQIQPNVIILK